MRTPTETTHVFDSRLKSMLRKAVVGGASRLGIGVEPLDDTEAFVPDESTKLPELVARFQHIPGMVPLRRCVHLYLLAFGGVRGDVIEIGSWQGRSTAFLAQACADSENGKVHAIDTFQGNPGHEDHYEVRGSRATLEMRFRENMRAVGIGDWVVTHPMASSAAIGEVRTASEGARLLFVDGEHTYEAVQSDLRNYADLVLPGGVIVFDDYSPAFQGDVRAIREHIDAHAGRYGRPFQQKNTLVLPRIG
jgi:predicted O-methyltransferase YrrM